MAFTPPDVGDFTTRFPRFAKASVPMMEAILAEALVAVDDSWNEDDRPIAILYLMAHLMVQENSNSVDRPGTIVSESFGPFSVSYGASGGRTSNLSSTEYGRRFEEMRRGNFPAIAVV